MIASLRFQNFGFSVQRARIPDILELSQPYRIILPEIFIDTEHVRIICLNQFNTAFVFDVFETQCSAATDIVTSTILQIFKSKLSHMFLVTVFKTKAKYTTKPTSDIGEGIDINDLLIMQFLEISKK